MFTGIVEDVGAVVSVSPLLACKAIAISTNLPEEGMAPGDSISVSGVCLTVTKSAPGSFTADVSAETLSKSTIGLLKPGDAVNLERALSLSGRLGGHIVYGHVDGVGVIREIRPEGETRLFHIQAEPSIMKFIVYKGAIAVDGVSLTISAVRRDAFETAVIPATMERTILKNARPGARVNLETDIIGKYVLKHLDAAKEGGITIDFLKTHGIA